MGVVPTKRVVRRANGEKIGINVADFDPELHEEIGATGGQGSRSSSVLRDGPDPGISGFEPAIEPPSVEEVTKDLPSAEEVAKDLPSVEEETKNFFSVEEETKDEESKGKEEG